MTTSRAARALAARARRPAPSTPTVPSVFGGFGDVFTPVPLPVQDADGEASPPVRPASGNRSAVTDIELSAGAPTTAGRTPAAVPLRLAAPRPPDSSQQPSATAPETSPVPVALTDVGPGGHRPTPTSTAPPAPVGTGPARSAVPMNPAFAGIPAAWQPELGTASPAAPPEPPVRPPEVPAAVIRPDLRGNPGTERGSVTTAPAAAPAQPSVTIGEIHVHTRDSNPAPDPLALLAPYADGLTARWDSRR